MSDIGLLGIDLGTSSVKAVIVDSRGKLIAEGREEYAVVSPRSGWAESDPAAWWRASVAAIRAVLAQVPQAKISAIGLSGQMHGIVPLDEQGQPTRAAILWADTRAEAELASYRALSARARQHLANPLAPGMAGPLLLWLARHEPEVYQATRYVLQPKDWLRYRLTGRFATDPSDASGTLLYDIIRDCWADDILADLGLRRDLLLAIQPAGSRAGGLSASAAAELGLLSGIPIAIGAADTAAAALGAGLLTPDAFQLTLGTGAQLIQLRAQLPQIEQKPRTHLYRAADDRNWYAMAAVQNAGLALDWVRRALAATWEELYASANACPAGSSGLIFLPYLTRERAHLPTAPAGGSFLNLRIDHTRAHLLHAALEGVAFGIRMAFEALPGASAATTIRLAGGGGVQPAWRQMLADILARDLALIDTPAASARGAALLGGIAAGIWSDAQATTSLAPGIQMTTSPNPQRVTAYQQAYTLFIEQAT